VVFLVLAVTWAVVLTFWFRSRSQPSLSDSVTQFHRHLRVIQRAAPATMVPANRLRGPVCAPMPLGPMLPPAAAEDHVAGLDGADRDGPTPALDPVRRGAAYREQVAANRRRRVQRRRRDVLIVLAAVAVATLVLTLVDRIPDAALAQIVSDVALAGYILLLAGAHTSAARRSARRRRQSLRPLRRMHVSRRSRAAASPEDFWDTPDAVDEGAGISMIGGGWDDADDSDDTAGFDADVLRRAVNH
jgi:hypothetical protein